MLINPELWTGEIGQILMTRMFPGVLVRSKRYSVNSSTTMLANYFRITFWIKDDIT